MLGPVSGWLRRYATGTGEFDYPAVGRVFTLAVGVACLAASLAFAHPYSAGWYIVLVVAAFACGWGLIELPAKPPFPLPIWVVCLMCGIPLTVIHLGGEWLNIVRLDAGSQYSLGLGFCGAMTLAVFGSQWEMALMAPPMVLLPLARQLVAGDFYAWGYWSVFILLGLVVGLVTRSQQREHEQLRRVQERLRTEAMERERRRIAFEIHDLVGHALGVVMLHLTAARMAAERSDAATAAATLAEAEEAGRQSVSDMHRMLALLRPTGRAEIEPALPGVEEVPALVDRFREAGMKVTLTIDGDHRALPPAAGLAVHRLVAESLTNAATHAPGSDVTVRIETAGGETTVEVENGHATLDPRHNHAGGLGLPGMRERVEALGGVLHAGPSATGWRVRARIRRTTAQIGQS